jgi:hypothetical protein
MTDLQQDPAPPPVPLPSERQDDAVVASYIYYLARELA